MKTKEITIKAQGEPKSALDMTPYEMAVEQERNQKYDAEFMEDFLDAHGWGDYTD